MDVGASATGDSVVSEFNNRIDAQRRILRIVNGSLRSREELFGLSSGAIERWVKVNQIDRDGTLFALLYEAASKLFFLSNKSQEQITEEYRQLSDEVGILTSKVEKACARAIGSSS
jgi:hypothetical protein